MDEQEITLSPVKLAVDIVFNVLEQKGIIKDKEDYIKLADNLGIEHDKRLMKAQEKARVEQKKEKERLDIRKKIMY